MLILCIDDEPQAITYLEVILPRGFSLVPVRSAGEISQALAVRKYDLVLIDIDFDNGRGLDLIPHIVGKLGSVPVVVHTRSTGTQDVVASMKLGAYYYLTKLVKRNVLLKLLMQCKDFHDGTCLDESTLYNREIDFIISGCEGNPNTEKLLQYLNSGPIFLNGERGTGKMLLAKYLHECLLRSCKNSNLTKNDLAVYSGAGLSSESQWIDLFGSNQEINGRRAGFAGIIEQNYDGVVYLPEVGNLRQDVQTALCQLIDQGTITRYRGMVAIPSKCKLIFGCTIMPDETGRIHGLLPALQDRIWSQRVELKPLRFRSRDLIALAWHYLQKAGQVFPAIRARNFHPTVLEYLVEHSWPGNIPEFRNYIFKCVRNCKGGVIKIEDLLK